MISKQFMDAIEGIYASESTNGGRAINIADELAVNICYKEPVEEESSLLEYPVTGDSQLDEMSDNMNWAAGAAFDRDVETYEL